MRRSPITAASFIAAIALSACTSSQDVLEPSAIQAEQQATAAAAGTVTAGVTAPPASPAPAGAPISTSARMQIAPIVGATVEAAGPLTERLAARARERGIGIAGSADTSATLVLKGYFSTMSEGKQTTVVYVWDVYDTSGNRIHRINGQQQSGANGEGWSSVPAQTMQSIADTTVDQLATWLSTQAG